MISRRHEIAVRRGSSKVKIADPTSNIDKLFNQLDQKYFRGKLYEYGVQLKWSEKVDSDIAGYCYEVGEKVKRKKSCYIMLNKPLLILRSRADVVDTLLHQMIHAALTIDGVQEENGGHGPKFKRLMKIINKVAKTNITVHHRFYDEGNHVVSADTVKKPRLKSSSDALVPPKIPIHKKFASPQPQRFPQINLTKQIRPTHKVIMREIVENCKFDDGHINLIGYNETSSDESDSECDSDSDCGSDVDYIDFDIVIEFDTSDSDMADSDTE